MSYEKNGKIHIVKLKKANIFPILRKKQELFSKTIEEEIRLNKYNLVINASFYGLLHKYLNLAATVSIPKNPLGANQTLNRGRIKLKDGSVHGESNPNFFYVAQSKKFDHLYFGQGDFLNAQFYNKIGVGIGGLGPLIINRLQYGVGNLYDMKRLPEKEKSSLKYTGKPLDIHVPYLIQRNNDTYVSLSSKSELSAGKGGFGYSTNKGWIIVISEDGNELHMDDLKKFFLDFGCQNALFIDGSNSVLLNYEGEFKVKASSVWKDDTQTAGLAFKVF